MPPTVARLSRARSREGRRRKGSESRIFHNAFHARRRSKTRRLLRNKKPRCAGLLQEPLTDSNRRPPPYHGGFGASRAYTRDHPRRIFSCKSALFTRHKCVARRRACCF